LNVLAIDTATEILSVALRCDSNRRMYAETRDTGLKHSQVLMPLVSRLMAEAGITPDQLDLIACTRGPGSFTGLRIGMATAKGLGVAVASARKLDQAPVVSVSTLEVMAAALPSNESLVVPVIDGRKNRFYAAIFRSGSRLTPDLDLDAMEIIAEIGRQREQAVPGDGSTRGGHTAAADVILTGPHARLFADRIDDSLTVVIDPACRRGNSETLIRLALAKYETDGPDAPGQGPVYVRSSDAQLSRHGDSK
jgi:tRNA threonylcarbamoyladenosine biosynthesis protein TsaB